MSIRRGVHVAREEGILTFLRKAARFTRRSLLDELTIRYWRRQGARGLTVGSHTATFPQETRYDAETIEYFRKNEAEMLSRVCQNVGPDDRVFDIGAHIGFYSCFLAQAAGDLVSFEPDPRNVALLRRNLSANQLEDVVEVLEVAASNEAGTVEFGNPNFDREDWSGKASINPVADGDRIDVETVRIDDLVARDRVGQPTVLKIDVEGAEGLVLEGMEETLRSDECRAVFCEIHKKSPIRNSIMDYGHSESDIFALLSEAGFEIDVIEERGSEVHVQAVK